MNIFLNLKRGAAMVAALFFFMSANALPAYKGKQWKTLPDGRRALCSLVGDERAHGWVADDDLLMQDDGNGRLRYMEENGRQLTVADLPALRQQRQKSSSRRRSLSIDDDGRTTFPTVGKVKGLVLLVEFSDASFNEEHTQELYTQMMNGDAYDYKGATGSARSYFYDQSYGLFDLDIDVVGPVKLDKPLKYYGQNDASGQDLYTYQMIDEAALQADTLYDVDFSKYDNDGDGFVDFVFAIYCGYGEAYGASSNTIWPHQSTLNTFGAGATIDGVRLNRYACTCELRGTSGTTLDGIGPFCHEFGHVIGLPDLYQTNGGRNNFCGNIDIMDSGAYNNNSRTPPCYSAYERWCMKWLEFEDIDSAITKVELPPLAQTPKAYRLTSSDPNEFFVLENRPASGWDAPLDGEGMLITHVAYDHSRWESNTVNNISEKPLVCIMPADGERSVNCTGDLFPGTSNNTSFTDFTTPSSLLWNGDKLGKSVSAITVRDDQVVTFAFMQDKLRTPQLMAASEVEETSFRATWSKVKNAQSYTLSVWSQLPDSLKPVPLAEDFDNLTQGTYTSADNPELTSDSLFLDRGWKGELLHDAGGMLQVGTYGQSGYVTTPKMSLQGDSFTVAYTLRAFTNRSMNYDFVVMDSVSGQRLDSIRMKATAAPQTIVRQYDGGSSAITVTLRTRKERIYIDEFHVVRGRVDSTEVFARQNPHQVIENLTDTTYVVSGLQSGVSYKYWVQAISGDPIYDSEKSTPDTVVMQGVIDDVPQLQWQSSATRVAVYSLDGRKVYEGSRLPGHLRGLYIVRKDGRTLKMKLDNQ